MKTIIAIFSLCSAFHVYAQSNCIDLYVKEQNFKNDFYLKLKAKQDTKLAEIIKCILPKYSEKKLASKQQKIKPGQTLLMPLAGVKRWDTSLKYSFGSFKSNSSRETEIYSSNIEGSYQFLLKKYLIAKADFGLKYMTADLSDSLGREVYDTSVVGKFTLSYDKYFGVKPYLFYKLDRYIVTDVSNNDLNYSFLYINSFGSGVRYSIKNVFFALADAEIIMPSNNSVNGINSGFKTGIGVDYRWKDFSAGYRYEYFQVDTKIYNDQGKQHFLTVGYSF